MEPHNNYSGSQRKLDPVVGKMIYFFKKWFLNDFSSKWIFWNKSFF